MKRALAAVLILVAPTSTACFGAVAGTTSTEHGPGTSPAPAPPPGGSGPAAPSTPSAPAATPPGERCLPDTETIDFGVGGAGLAGVEGKPVWAHAVERNASVEANWKLASGLAVVVRLGATVAGGAFELACPRSLAVDSDYPAFAVFVDANGDGFCDPDDLGAFEQNYAWIASQKTVGSTFAASDFRPVSTWQGLVGTGADRVDFCGYFGFPTR
jgi:hypothetical protein